MQLSSSLYRRQAGFTLIEVLAVLVVIGIAAAVVSFSIGSGSRPLQVKSSARQLYSSINLAAEEAVFTNKQFGLRFDIEYDGADQFYSYEWLQYNPEEKVWLSVQAEEFAKQSLPIAVILKIEVEKQDIIIGGDNQQDDALFEVKKQKDEKKKIYPDIYFLSSGEMQNFSIIIADEELPESEYHIKGNMLGQLNFKRPDEKE